MSLPREERLKALGLWPVWRLREAGVGSATPLTEAIGTREAQSPGPLISQPAAQPTATPPPARPSSPAAVVGHATTAGMDWDALRQAVSDCQACELAKSRIKPVFGVGDPNAEWLIIGEAPGADEDRQGEPFVGQAGKLLDAMLAAIGLRRGDNVYIANILKSRPPGNRDPKSDEVSACLPYLERQIDLIRPRLILVLGRIAAQNLLRTDTAISRLRGQVHEYRGIPLVVTYHPAYLLRSLADKAKSWEDLCLARDTLAAVKKSS